MHFARAGRLDHLHDLAAGRPAHERIIEQHDPLAFQDAAYWIQLHLHAEVTDRLLRLNERPSDVVIADQSHAQRQLRLLGKTGRRADAGVWNRHDNVGGNAAPRVPARAQARCARR